MAPPGTPIVSKSGFSLSNSCQGPSWCRLTVYSWSARPHDFFNLDRHVCRASSMTSRCWRILWLYCGTESWAWYAKRLTAPRLYRRPLNGVFNFWPKAAVLLNSVCWKVSTQSSNGSTGQVCDVWSACKKVAIVGVSRTSAGILLWYLNLCSNGGYVLFGCHTHFLLFEMDTLSGQMISTKRFQMTIRTSYCDSTWLAS